MCRQQPGREELYTVRVNNNNRKIKRKDNN